MASFGHAPCREPGPLGTATRRLCAAAYVDRSFAELVLGELVGSRRAVARSVDIDLEPVIWHSLRARRLALGRDLVLSGVLIAGIVVSGGILPIVSVAGTAVMRRMYRGKWDQLSFIEWMLSMLYLAVAGVVVYNSVLFFVVIFGQPVVSDLLQLFGGGLASASSEHLSLLQAWVILASGQ